MAYDSRDSRVIFRVILGREDAVLELEAISQEEHTIVYNNFINRCIEPIKIKMKQQGIKPIYA